MIIKLHFVKVNPVGNVTIFILDPVPRLEQMEIAKKLMDYNNIHGEQVGFIEMSNSGEDLNNQYIRLQMMGGEFCGNAARSLAAWMVHSQYANIEKLEGEYLVTLNVSGVEDRIKCIVSDSNKKNSYWAAIDMPLPLSTKEFDFHYNGNLIKALRVDFPGITHFIVDESKIEDRDKFYKIVKAKMDNSQYDAFGIMYYDCEKNFLTPLVYVKATDSLYWEKSCASGTSALGAALAYERKSSLKENIIQPGGSLEVSVGWRNSQISNIKLKGLVDIIAEGIVYI